MNVSERVLARRYARAFYESARERREEERAGKELPEAARKLSAAMAEYQHPRVGVEEKKRRLRADLGAGFSPRTLRFLELLIEKKRFALLPFLAADYARLYDEGRGVVHASARSAAELSDAERRGLEQRLAARSGKTVALDVKLAPELIAGVVVRMGDWVFDASLRGELRRLRERLTQ